MYSLEGKCSFLFNLFLIVLFTVTIASSIVYLLISPAPYQVILKILKIDIFLSILFTLFVLYYIGNLDMENVIIVGIFGILELVILSIVSNPFIIFPLSLILLFIIDLISENINELAFLLIILLSALMIASLNGVFIPIKKIYVMFPNLGFALAFALSMLPLLMLLKTKLS